MANGRYDYIKSEEYQRKMLEAKQRLEKHLGREIPCTPGIYFFYRAEDGFKYGYVGQAKNLLQRLAQHLIEHDSHIDKSLYKRKLSNEKEGGWKIWYVRCGEDQLNKLERLHMRVRAGEGFQLYNKTIGGQDEGKHGMLPNNSGKGYRDGLKQGYTNARRFVANLFDKNLTAQINGKETVNKQKAMAKFEDFIHITGDSSNDTTTK